LRLASISAQRIPLLRIECPSRYIYSEDASQLRCLFLCDVFDLKGTLVESFYCNHYLYNQDSIKILCKIKQWYMIDEKLAQVFDYLPLFGNETAPFTYTMILYRDRTRSVPIYRESNKPIKRQRKSTGLL
jgi:hypothetical protein